MSAEQLGFDGGPQGCPTGTCSHAAAHHDGEGRCLYPGCSCGLPPLPVPAAVQREAIQRVDLNADDEWKEAAYRTLIAVAGRGVPFTADDVWMALAASDARTHEPSALGPVFLRAARAGVIVKTDRLVKSIYTEAHRARGLAPRHHSLTEWRAA